MWTCNNCKEEIGDTFESCWNCGTTKNGNVVNPEFNKIKIKEHISHNHNYKYELLAVFFRILTTILFIFGFITIGMHPIGLPILYASGICFNLSKRLRRISFEELLSKDPRNPILLLRPFSYDNLEIKKFSLAELLVPHLSPNFYKRISRYSVEEEISKIFYTIGPLIAIGRPGEKLPPAGAVRVYADNLKWQSKVIELAKRSKLVIIIIDNSPGLLWELQNIPTIIGIERILLLLPPNKKERRKLLSNYWIELTNNANLFKKVREVNVNHLHNCIGIYIQPSFHPEFIYGNLKSLKKYMKHNYTYFKSMQPKITSTKTVNNKSEKETISHEIIEESYVNCDLCHNKISNISVHQYLNLVICKSCWNSKKYLNLP